MAPDGSGNRGSCGARGPTALRFLRSRWIAPKLREIKTNRIFVSYWTPAFDFFHYPFHNHEFAN